MLLRKEGLSFLRSWPTRVAWLSSLPSALVQKPRQIQPLNHPSFHAFHRSIVPSQCRHKTRADIVTKKVATLTLQPLTIALFRRDSDVCPQKPQGSQETMACAVSPQTTALPHRHSALLARSPSIIFLVDGPASSKDPAQDCPESSADQIRENPSSRAVLHTEKQIISSAP